VNLRRVAVIDWVVALCGALLIASLQLTWFLGFGPLHRETTTTSNGGVNSLFAERRNFNAWDSIPAASVIFLIVGVLALALLIATATQGSAAIPIGIAAFVALGGLVASILAAVHLIWPPDLGSAAVRRILGPVDIPGGYAPDTRRAAGAWVGTAAAVGIAVSAWFSLRSERRGALAAPETPSQR
jgi:hypothetical protein